MTLQLISHMVVLEICSTYLRPDQKETKKANKEQEKQFYNSQILLSDNKTHF